MGLFQALMGAPFFVAGLVMVYLGPTEKARFYMGIYFVVMSAAMLLLGLRTPRKITWEDGRVTFRSPLRAVTVESSEILSVKASTQSITLKHSNGRLRLERSYTGFHHFMTKLSKANPSVEINEGKKVLRCHTDRLGR